VRDYLGCTYILYGLSDCAIFLFEHYGLFRLFGLQLFMIVVVYLSFVSMDIIDVNLLCLWVP
jgi:hypothetical protein